MPKQNKEKVQESFRYLLYKIIFYTKIYNLSERANKRLISICIKYKASFFIQRYTILQNAIVVTFQSAAKGAIMKFHILILLSLYGSFIITSDASSPDTPHNDDTLSESDLAEEDRRILSYPFDYRRMGIGSIQFNIGMMLKQEEIDGQTSRFRGNSAMITALLHKKQPGFHQKILAGFWECFELLEAERSQVEKHMTAHKNLWKLCIQDHGDYLL